MQSPIKALEKLSEEAKLERQRSTTSLQENVRLKIQIENLKQHVDYSNAQVEALEAEVSKLNSTVDSLHETIQRTEFKLAEEHEALLCEQKRASNAEGNLRAARDEICDKVEEIDKLNSECESRDQLKAQFAADVKARDEAVTVAQEDVHRLERQNKAWETKYVLLDSAHNELIRNMEILRLQNAQSGTYAEQLTAQEVSNKELRKELESLMLASHNGQVELSDLKKSKLELEVREEQHLAELSSYQAQEAELRETIAELEAMQTELSSRIAADGEILEAARSKAAVAARGREFVDLQVKELSAQYDRVCEHNRALEEEVTSVRVAATQSQTDLLQSRDKVAQLESQLQAVESNMNMSVEVGYLRTQLAEMRKKLIRRDMSDLDPGSSSKAARERENSGRLVYEGIILDLRTEIERLTVQYHDNQSRHEDLVKKASRVDQLEEEIRLYKECVTSNGLENDAIQSSYSEAIERSEKSMHEKHLILRDLKSVELDNEALRTKATQLSDELNLEKAKYKKMHVDKLAAERRCSELLASKSKAEASLDELKQGYDSELLELDRLRRGQRESYLACEDLKRRADESAGREHETERKCQELRDSLTEVLGREQSLKNEFNLVQTQKVTLDKELGSLQHSIRNQTVELEQKDAEIDSLNEMIRGLQKERERYRKDISLQEQSRADLQLSTLRSELDQTVHDWKTTESVADEYMKEIQRLKQENGNEQEKIKLYKNQIALLEDRVKVALHELSVYRSLDVYHTTVASELGHAREENASSRMRESVGRQAPAHPRHEPPFGSPAAAAVSRGLDMRESPSRDAYSSSGYPPQEVSHYPPQRHSPYVERSQQQPYRQSQYPARDDLYAGAPSHVAGQGLGRSQYQHAYGPPVSAPEPDDRFSGRNYYHSKDSHWDVDSQISTSSLPPPPYSHPRTEHEQYEQRRQLRAERELKKEKLLLQELHAGRPAVSQSHYGQSQRSHGDVGGEAWNRSHGGTYGADNGIGEPRRQASPAAQRPTSSLYASRPLSSSTAGRAAAAPARSSDSSELISRLRQSYLSSEETAPKPQALNEPLSAFNPSYLSSPSSSVGDAVGSAGGLSSSHGGMSQSQSVRASTNVVSKSEYEKAKQRLARR